MSQKKPEHIIDYIIKKTERHHEREHWKFYNNWEKRKFKLDDQIFFCVYCKHTWSKVPDWVDSFKWIKYPKDNIPTIGKKRKICFSCEENYEK